MKDKIIKILDKIRPMLKVDGGNVELIEINEKKGLVKVRLTGVCSHCPMAEMTFNNGIKEVLKREVEGVKNVELIN
ncbi:NifU family protein [Patescibacteria group bacterium]